MLQKLDARRRGQTVIEAWRGFWFRVEPAYTIGLIRIAFGALVILWALELKTNLYIRFGTEGVLPRPPSSAYTWSIFERYSTDTALLVGWIVLIVAAIALTVGWHSRIAAILVFILIVSFERRNPWVFNAGDMLIRIEALFLALAPSGAALSFDQRRRTGSFWSAQHRTVWALRLIQIQVSIIYVSTVIAKLRGETWQNGTAVLYSLRQYDMLMMPTPAWVTENLVVANAMTWGTLVIELAIGLLVWNRRCRPWVLAAGVVLHVSIMLTIAVGLFSFAMFVLYLAFIPPERVKAMADKLSDALDRIAVRLKRRGLALVGDDASAPGQDDVAVLEDLDASTDDRESSGPSARNGDTPIGARASRQRLDAGHPDRRLNGSHRAANPAPSPVSVPQLGADDGPAGRHARTAQTRARNPSTD
ncbi:HTTM domain-containing protein [Mycolicibacterium sp. XJ2546]